MINQILQQDKELSTSQKIDISLNDISKGIKQQIVGITYISVRRTNGKTRRNTEGT